MSPAIDGIAAILPVLEPPPAPGPRDSQDSFAGHLQQASQPNDRSQSVKPSDPPRAEKPVASDKPASTQKAPNSDSTRTNTKPSDGETNVEQPPATEETSASVATAATIAAIAKELELKNAKAAEDDENENASAATVVALTALDGVPAVTPTTPQVIAAPVDPTQVIEKTSVKLEEDAKAAAKEPVVLKDTTATILDSASTKEAKVKPVQEAVSKTQVKAEVAVDAAKVVVQEQAAKEASAAEPAAEKKSDSPETKSTVDTTKPVDGTAAVETIGSVITTAPTTPTSNRGDDDKPKKDTSRTDRDVAALEPPRGNDPAANAESQGGRTQRPSLDVQGAKLKDQDGAARMTEADRARFVQRVTRAIHSATENGGPIRLRLSPPELGSLRLEIQIVDGQMSARIEAETPAARQALLDNLTVLRERLEQQDIKVTRFDVDLFDGAGGNLSQSPQRDPGQDSLVPRHALRGGVEAVTESDPASSVSRPTFINDGRLNVVI